MLKHFIRVTVGPLPFPQIPDKAGRAPVISFQRQLKIAAGDIKKVGLNCFVEDEEERAIEFHPYREEEAKKQVARLNHIKQQRDNKAVQQALSEVRAAASGSDNVMPAAMNAVEAYATVGEICGELREVFGTYQEPVRF